jgi:hypothetical protein
MLRLPRTPRGTWLLAGAVWLAGVGALWCMLPYRPRAAWATEEPVHVHGFIPGTSVVLTSSSWLDTGTMGGPLLARDAATGEIREWLPDGERLTLVNPGVDGRSVVVGRVVAGRARLFLHDAASGDVVAELPRDGREIDNEPRGRDDQAAAVRPDGRRIAYADPDGHHQRVRVWDVETKKEFATLPDAGPPLAWSPDGESLAYCMRRHDVMAIGLWDASAGQTRKLGDWLPREHRPHFLAFSPDCRTLVAPVFFLGSDRKSSFALTDWVYGWDVVSGNERYRVAVQIAAFPPGVTWFATDDPVDTLALSTVHRRDYATGADLGEAVLKPVSRLWLDPSPNGKLIFGLAVQRDPVMEWINQNVLGRPAGGFTNLFPGLWDTQSGRQRYSLPMAIEIMVGSWSYGWSSDGTLLAMSNRQQLAVWDVPPRRSIAWLTAGAALFALQLAVIARWRVRRLRREAAA